MAPKTDTNKKYVQNMLDCMLKNMEGNLYDHFMSMRIFTFTMNKISHMSSKNYEETGYNCNLDLLTILY